MSVNPLNMLRPSNPSQRGGKKYGCLSKAQEKKGFKGRREPQLDTPLGSPASVYGSPLMHATGAAQNGAEKSRAKKSGGPQQPHARDGPCLIHTLSHLPRPISWVALLSLPGPISARISFSWFLLGFAKLCRVSGTITSLDPRCRSGMSLSPCLAQSPLLMLSHLPCFDT